MAISPLGSAGSGFGSAIAAGWKLQLEARRLTSVMEFVDIVDPALGPAFQQMEAMGQSIVNAGVEIGKIEATGAVVDMLA